MICIIKSDQYGTQTTVRCWSTEFQITKRVHEGDTGKAIVEILAELGHMGYEIVNQKQELPNVKTLLLKKQGA